MMTLDKMLLCDGQLVACLLLTIIAHSQGVLSVPTNISAGVTGSTHSPVNVTDITLRPARVVESSSDPGLYFTMGRTPGLYYCGHLQCSVSLGKTDTNSVHILELSIYDAARTNNTLKLALVSVFAPDLHVDPDKTSDVNAIGSVSRYEGNLVVDLRDEKDCMYVSFLCQLDYVDYGNMDDHPQVRRVVVSPDENSGNSRKISDPFSQMFQQLKTNADDVERQLSLIYEQNNATEQKHDQMEAKLDRILLQLSQQQFSQEDCMLGVITGKSRERFMLWGKYQVLCDTETDGGRWVIIQRHTKNVVRFYRGWSDYKKGFGTPYTDYWLGLDNIHNLTSLGYNQLRVDLEYQGKKYFALYSDFRVADEPSKYKMTLGTYSGTAGDSLRDNNYMYFSTYDRDNDASSTENCASTKSGAWWYKACHYSNLNGVWGSEDYIGMSWRGVIYPGSVSLSEMKVRYI